MIKQRKCLVCGEIHTHGICPIIQRKLDKYHKSSKRNFLIGNIFLECIHNNIDFYQILSEIAEINEFWYERNPNIELIDLELIEYFAVSLKCKSKNFFKDPETTSIEYDKMIDNTVFSVGSIHRNENNRIQEIEFKVEINNLYNFRYEFYIQKALEENDKWCYNLILRIIPTTDVFYSEKYLSKRHPSGKHYAWGGMNWISKHTFLLLSEQNGKLKEKFEYMLKENWDKNEIVTELPYDDFRFHAWMTNLEKTTKSGKLEWDKENENTYCTTYGKSDIKININLDSKYGNSELLYVRDGEGGTGLRFGNRCTNVYIESGESDKRTEIIEGVTSTERNDRILRLANLIEKIYSNRNDIINYNSLPLKKMEHSDVLIKTKSMICHNREHYITPVRGIVKLLNIDNSEINYEIYVGYCKSCNEYYVFTRDYNEMLKIGTPLCTVYYNGKEEHRKVTEFKFKSQSVLNAMGYSVDATSDLSKEERQSILKETLDKQLVTTHDLLSFLNWLIKTRETQVRMDQAVEKWKIDYKFVSEYQKEKRDIVKINSIHVN